VLQVSLLQHKGRGDSIRTCRSDEWVALTAAAGLGRYVTLERSLRLLDDTQPVVPTRSRWSVFQMRLWKTPGRGETPLPQAVRWTNI
jgi:hypothetical protein